MFSLPNFSVKRPVCILIAVVTLVSFGISSIFSMQMESTPSMSMPMLMVMTSYSDASPDEIDEMVTQVIEDSLMSVTDVESIMSTSSEGMSLVMLEFDYDVDTDEKNTDVTSILSFIRLPDGCNDPIVIAMDTSNMNTSIMSLSIDTTGDDRIVSYVEENIVTQIERISGVASVSVTGDTQNYISVLLDETMLTQYGITMSSVASAIASAEYETTLGAVDRGDISLSVVGSMSYDTYYELEDIPISLSTGDIIHLSDVAAITMTPEETTSYSRRNGQTTIGLSITQEQTGNTVFITSEIADLVEEINNSDEGVVINILSDSGETIYENIYSVVTSLVTGLVIAVFVLMFFFGEWKSSLIVAITMPLSIFAALLMMAYTEMTLNMMSLGGLVVGIGMMVDSSIVVLDSCFSAKSEGNLGFRDSVAKGANMVTSSIIASTATTIVVFLPIALMDGISGQMFWDVCMTVVFSLAASLIGALTVVPVLFVKLRPVEKTESLVARMMEGLKKYYVKLLDWALDRRIAVVIIAIATLVFSLHLYTLIPMELMPSDASNSVSFSIETKTGLTAEEGNKIVTQLEAFVANDERVETYSVSVGGTNMMGSASGSSMSVTIKDEYSTEEVSAFSAEIQALAEDVENCRVTVRQGRSMPGMSSSTDVSVKLQGESLTTLDTFADEIVAALSGLSNYEYASSSLSDGSPRVLITVDPILSGSVGMTPSGVLSAVSQKLVGVTAMTLVQDSVEYDVVVEYDPTMYSDMADLYDMLIDTTSGAQVALTDLATISYETAPSSISRVDGEYVVTVSATPVDDTANTAMLTTEMLTLVDSLSIPDDVTIYEGDDMQSMNEEFAYIFNALLIAVYLVFAVMAIQFESLIFPIVVMISLPFAAAGAFLALYITGNSISMTSLLGLVMLAGIVVNNAIVLIDHAQIMKAEGHKTREALLIAGQARLRPILMSSLTTIVGLMPMAFGIGGSISMMQGISYTVIGGLSLSTLLTLVLIPTFYFMFDPDARRDRKEERKAKREAKKAAKQAAKEASKT